MPRKTVDACLRPWWNNRFYGEAGRRSLVEKLGLDWFQCVGCSEAADEWLRGRT